MPQSASAGGAASIARDTMVASRSGEAISASMRAYLQFS